MLGGCFSDKGLVLFTGCSHASLVNVCKHAREVFPEIPLHALSHLQTITPHVTHILSFGRKVMGGFHLGMV